MKKKRYTLAELERDLGPTVQELIGYGADDELTVHVIADEWPGKKAGNSDAESNAIADGAVDLLPSDLLKALGADHTKVRKVRTADGDIVALDSIQKVMHGVHYVTAAERDRFEEALKPTPQPTAAASEDALPPYLDSSHKYYSFTLEAAVSAWLAQYADGGFKEKSLGHKLQIEGWLKKHRSDKVKSDNARECIATVVNPNKDGGNQRTKK